MIKKSDLHNREGYILFNKEKKRGIFCFFSEGKTKSGHDYSNVRLHDIARTEGSSSRKARYYWRRRRITPYDKEHNDTVTCHCDIHPESIPELIQMLGLVYEDVTGNKVAAKTTVELKKEVVEKSTEKTEEDKIIKDLGGLM